METFVYVFSVKADEVMSKGVDEYILSPKFDTSYNGMLFTWKIFFYPKNSLKEKDAGTIAVLSLKLIKMDDMSPKKFLKVKFEFSFFTNFGIECDDEISFYKFSSREKDGDDVNSTWGCYSFYYSFVDQLPPEIKVYPGNHIKVMCRISIP